MARRQDPAQLVRQALDAFAAGAHDRAESLALSVLRVVPNSAEAVQVVAATSAQRGDFAASIRYYDRAVRLLPRSVPIMNNRARVLSELGRHEEALAALDRLLELAPGTHEALNNRGNALHALRRYEAAAESFRAALALAPQQPVYRNNLANALKELRRDAEALANFDEVLQLQPEYADAWNNRGVVLLQMNRHAEAVASFDRALALVPGHVVYLNNRGPALAKLKRTAEAVADFDAVLARVPDFPFVLGKRFAAQAAGADWRSWDQNVAALERGCLAGRPVAIPLTVMSATDDPAVQLAAARTWSREVGVATAQVPRERVRDPHRRLRIGFYSEDFGEHPVGQLVARWFELHDRSAVEVIGFATGPNDGSEQRRRIERACDHFVDAVSLSNLELAQHSNALGIDVAVDLMGHTGDARRPAFAIGLAPLVVNCLGYPGSVGTDAVDYIVADRWVVPEAAAVHYDERIVWMPDAYLVTDGDRPRLPVPSRESLGLPADAVVLNGFHQAYKIGPAVFDAWLSILERVPRAVLWLSAQPGPVHEAFLRAAAARGIAADRLVFAGFVPGRDAHLARLGAADLYLDAFPYNAHSTAADSLFMGVPVVTLSGRGFASRVAGSLVTTLGVPELVASDRADFVARASALAGDPAALATMKERVAARGRESALFDTARWCRHFETALRTMWQRYCDGRPAESFRVPPIGNESR